MRSRSIEVPDVLVEHRAKMRFAKNDDVIETLATNTSEKSLAHGVHERGVDCCLHDANASTLCNAIEVRPELAVVISNDELWPTLERRGLAQLLSRPGFVRRARDPHVDHFPGVHVNDEEREQRAKPDVVELKEITGPDGVVLEKGSPGLAVTWGTRRANMTLYCSLRDANTELQEFAADALGAPGSILYGHPPNERDGVGRDLAQAMNIFKTCSSRIPQRSCGGRVKPAQFTSAPLPRASLARRRTGTDLGRGLGVLSEIDAPRFTRFRAPEPSGTAYPEPRAGLLLRALGINQPNPDAEEAGTWCRVSHQDMDRAAILPALVLTAHAQGHAVDSVGLDRLEAEVRNGTDGLQREVEGEAHL